MYVFFASNFLQLQPQADRSLTLKLILFFLASSYQFAPITTDLFPDPTTTFGLQWLLHDNFLFWAEDYIINVFILEQGSEWS